MEYSKENIVRLLALENKEEIEQLRQSAYKTMSEHCGEKVYLRGLVEFSNYCKNDCYYCGIRKSNSNVERYHLEQSEIVEAANWAAEQGYGSFVLQSGERTDPKFIDFVCEVLQKIKIETKSAKLPNGLGITLCVGEQNFETYRRFFEAGAHRYLLRIETTNPDLYTKLHPKEMKFEDRLHCLAMLREIGYQVGTGVMIGIPGQTIEDLANDILFFKEHDIDMIGMGPFINHEDTPMGAGKTNDFKDNKLLFLSLKMIAIARLVLKDVNIAATTALQAISPFGREHGLRYGANVVMPLMTPQEVRKSYQLYDGKPCIDEFGSECAECLAQRIVSTDREIARDEWGDSKHFINKTMKKNDKST
jgi:biotin synthase